MVDVQGSWDPRFETVRAAFAKNFDVSGDVGASAAVMIDGELVVDLWGGHVDVEHSEPWQRDTIVNVFSSTKTMTALCALLLADRGELDLHAPVARYWPEFAAGGKERIEVRHLLGHTAGLASWQEPITVETLYDWEKATSLLAAQAPWWEPGTASGYHGITQGYLVGEVVRRITGHSLGQFFAREIAGPLGADFHIGLAPVQFSRVANVIPPEGGQQGAADPASIAARATGNPRFNPRAAWSEAWRRAEIPAANGHGNARSMALCQSVLACEGELYGRRFLSASGCEAVLEEQANGVDLVLGAPLRLGMGYGLNTGPRPMTPNPRSCFWGGAGGSLVVVDMDLHLVVAYAMNQMAGGTLGDARAARILRATYGSLAA
jgi:CubicO group peptidase (beta-lactamase class C family)